MWIMFADRPINTEHMTGFKLEISKKEYPCKHYVEIAYGNYQHSEYFETQEEAIGRYNEIGEILDVKGFTGYYVAPKPDN